MSTSREKRPTSTDWTEVPSGNPLRRESLAESAWTSGGTLVVSSLVIAELPDGTGSGPQWHVSVSEWGARPSRPSLRLALKAFGMLGAEEDNHHPGVARHFWRPLDAAHRVDCQCKASEVTVVEPDGYRWTNPREGACRGCEFTRMTGTPCPLHTQKEATR